MNTPITNRRKFLALSGATAIVAGLQPQALFAAEDPMSAGPLSLARFQSQVRTRFTFHDESGMHQSNLWLNRVEDLTIEPAVEQFALEFFSWQEAALPDGIYNVTSPTGEMLTLNTELTRENRMGLKFYNVLCGLLQA